MRTVSKRLGHMRKFNTSYVFGVKRLKNGSAANADDFMLSVSAENDRVRLSSFGMDEGHVTLPWFADGKELAGYLRRIADSVETGELME